MADKSAGKPGEMEKYIMFKILEHGTWNLELEERA